MGKLQVFESVYEQLSKMEEEKIIDISIVKHFDELIQDLKMQEQFWVDNRKVPIEDTFVIYHASRNSRLILEKMKNKFLVAEQKQANPKVIEDSLRVMPNLLELYATISPLVEKPITPEIRSLVLERLRAVKNIATEASMIPSFEEETKGVDPKLVKKQFANLTDTLQAIFSEK